MLLSWVQSPGPINLSGVPQKRNLQIYQDIAVYQGNVHQTRLDKWWKMKRNKDEENEMHNKSKSK